MLGAAVSIYGAINVTKIKQSQSDFTRSRRPPPRSLTSWKLYVHHQLDLITSIESFLLGNPHPTSAQFTAWTKAVGLLESQQGPR